jgi:hypothetical protein
MPEFRVWERVDAVRLYKVEAKDEAEARRLVEEAEVDYDEQDYVEFDVFEVEEVDESSYLGLRSK